MFAKILITVFAGFFLCSRESLSQVVFPDASGATVAPAISTVANFFGITNAYPTYPASPFIQTNVCVCVNTGRCPAASGAPSSDGSGLIDIRIVNTATGISTGTTVPLTSIASSGITPIIASQSFCQTNLELCCPAGGYSCGVRFSPFTNAPTPIVGQAPYGAYPWQAVILTTGNIYVGSGVLIDHMHLLTVAHKVSGFVSNGVTLKIRLGEWDAQSTSEPYAQQEFTVTRIFIHPLFQSSSLINSVAILRVTPNVPLGQLPTISTGCLPASSVTPGLRCWVAGWGAQNFVSGAQQAIQTHVDVPIVDQATCQTKLRTTRLGPGFALDTNSFMCAGGEAGKDACTGDGGAPLMCHVAGRWYAVGLVAWGIGCGTTDIPGVYINVTNYISWIQATTRS